MGTLKIFLKICLFSVVLFNISTEAAPPDSSPQSQSSSTFDNVAVKNAISNLNAQFSKVLLKESKPEENIVFSSFNVYTALALLHLGATGKTKNELSTALGLPAEENKLLETHQGLGKLLNDIQNNTSADVSVANGVFVQQGTKLNDSYLEASKKYYKNEVQSVNFAKGGNEATDTVNKWISSKTKDRIPKLFASELSPATNLLLASALYFNATWSNTFAKGLTRSEKFHTGVKEVDVKMMNSKHSVPYQNNEASQFEAISLPYLRKEFCMLILLPYSNITLKTLVDTLKPEDHQQLIKDISSNSKYTYVDYKIPRMKLKWSQSINQRIIELGAGSIFGSAELANMVAETQQLAVSDVTHAAEVEVDEDGTIATAVTTIQVVRTSLQLNFDEPVKFYVNRPFIFSIFHPSTGISLFTGIVHNPGQDAFNS